ncbi:MAG: TonB family protein [Acidobacteriaceae bacterium]
MSSLNNYVMAYFINSLWQIPLLTCAAWIVSKIWRQFAPESLHKVWAATLLITVVVPGCFTSSKLLAISSRSASRIIPAISDNNSVQNHPIYANGVLSLPSALYLILLCFYLVAFLYFCFRLGLGLYKAFSIAQDACEVALAEKDAAVWNRCSQVFSTGNAQILSSKDIHTPVTLGFRNAVLLVPYNFFHEFSQDEIAAALGHECAHIERRDFLKNLLYELLTLGISYHPLTWFLKSRISQTRELLCDVQAAERLTNSTNYAKSLLRLATAISAHPRAVISHAIGIFDANILEKRIMYLTSKKPRMNQKLQYALALAGVIVLSVTCISALALSTHVELQPNSTTSSSPSSNSNGKIYHVGNGVTAPKLIYSVDPTFPESASQSRGKFTGICILGLTVDETGTPRNIHIVRSLSPAFDASAIKAVQQYRFKPATFKGKAVPVAISIETNFKRY